MKTKICKVYIITRVQKNKNKTKVENHQEDEDGSNSGSNGGAAPQVAGNIGTSGVKIVLEGEENNNTKQKI